MNKKFLKDTIICLGCGAVYEDRAWIDWSPFECPECSFDDLMTLKDLMESDGEWDGVRMDLFLTSLMTILEKSKVGQGDIGGKTNKTTKR